MVLLSPLARTVQNQKFMQGMLQMTNKAEAERYFEFLLEAANQRTLYVAGEELLWSPANGSSLTPAPGTDGGVTLRTGLLCQLGDGYLQTLQESWEWARSRCYWEALRDLARTMAAAAGVYYVWNSYPLIAGIVGAAWMFGSYRSKGPDSHDAGLEATTAIIKEIKRIRG